MQALGLILVFVCSVTLNAHAQSGSTLLSVDPDHWGSSADHFVQKGFKTDRQDELFLLERTAKKSAAVRRSKNKIKTLSRRQNAPGKQGFQTATFFENKLVRFKQTVVFDAAKESDILDTIRSFETQIRSDALVMTEAAQQRRDAYYSYLVGNQIYVVKLLFNKSNKGGVFQIESRWSAMDETLNQYERHLRSVPTQK